MIIKSIFSWLVRSLLNIWWFQQSVGEILLFYSPLAVWALDIWRKSGLKSAFVRVNRGETQCSSLHINVPFPLSPSLHRVKNLPLTVVQQAVLSLNVSSNICTSQSSRSSKRLPALLLHTWPALIRNMHRSTLQQEFEVSAALHIGVNPSFDLVAPFMVQCVRSGPI